MMRMYFLSNQNGKYYHQFCLWRANSCVYLPVTNTMVVQSYSWDILFDGNTIFQKKCPTRFAKQSFNRYY